MFQTLSSSWVKNLKVVLARNSQMNRERPFWSSAQLWKVDHFLVLNEWTKCNPNFAQNPYFKQKVYGETYNREWLVYFPSKGQVAYIVLFVKSFQITHLLRLQLLMVWWLAELLSYPSWWKLRKLTNAMLTYLTRKRRYTLTSKLEKQNKRRLHHQFWWYIIERNRL